MAEKKDQATQASTAATTRAVDLVGDSPELIAFAMLRTLAQLEQELRAPLDREWLLDAYVECLEAVHGRRKAKSNSPEARGVKKSRN